MAIYITGDTHGTYDVNKMLKLKDALCEGDYIAKAKALCAEYGIALPDDQNNQP
jgi:hypothetical protein